MVLWRIGCVLDSGFSRAPLCASGECEHDQERGNWDTPFITSPAPP